MWAGDDIAAPEPVVIVRLLVRRETRGGWELFCVRTTKGLDIPTMFLGGDDGWRPAPEGVAALTSRYLLEDAPTRCVGFVRNVVPVPDETYRLPTPLAHVPVFTPRDPSPVRHRDGDTWIGASDAPSLVAQRHWWPIAREVLAWRHE
jgi:hypothetical protein